MSACEAYRKAGYEGAPQKNAWIIQENSGVRHAIDEKLGKFVKSVEDAIRQTAMQAFETEKDLMLNAENEFARIKASQDILDRAGLKSADKLNLGGQEGNPIQSTLTLINASELINNKPKILDEED